MSGSAKLRVCHDLACLPCSAPRTVNVRDVMAITVYSHHDEKVSCWHQPPKSLNQTHLNVTL